MALSLSTYWHYWGTTDQATSRTALRTQMGTSYTNSPADATLDLAWERAVRFFEEATGWFFVKVDGELDLNGNGEVRLNLPYPVVSSGQGGDGIESITLFDEDDAVDDALYEVNQGAQPGVADPRLNAYVEYVANSSVATASRSPEAELHAVWPYGVQNIHLDGSWGYLEPDGSTPVLVKKAIAKLVIRELADLDDCDDQEDLRRGGIVSESVTGRSHTFHANAVGHGVTGDPEIDRIIRRYRRPPEARIARPPRRNRRRNRRWSLL